MEPVWIILVMVFIIVGLAFYVGRQTQKHDMEMERIQDEIEMRKRACDIQETVANSDINSIRDELRENAE